MRVIPHISAYLIWGVGGEGVGAVGAEGVCSPLSHFAGFNFTLPRHRHMTMAFAALEGEESPRRAGWNQVSLLPAFLRG